jgi:hypothetical protein
MWHNVWNVFGDGHLIRRFCAARLRIYSLEENHEQSQQDGALARRGSFHVCGWCPVWR